MHSTITLKDIKVVRGTEPDTAHGGKLVDGVILGAKKSVCRWRIKNETKLYHDREEAKKAVYTRMLSEELFTAMGFNRDRPRELTPQEIVNRLKHNGHAVKSVLMQAKYRPIVCEKTVDNA